MLNYMHHFLKIRLVFHTLYLWSEVGDPQFFFAFLTQVNHYLTAVKVKKKSRNRKIFARTFFSLHYCLLTNVVSIVDISFFSWISFTGGKDGKSKRWTDKWTAFWVCEGTEGVIWQTPRCLWSTKRHWAYNSVAWIVNYWTLERKTVLSASLSQLFYESCPRPSPSNREKMRVLVFLGNNQQWSSEERSEISLRSKRFCAVREQRITGRWMEWTRSFFAPKPYGNACYAGYGEIEKWCALKSSSQVQICRDFSVPVSGMKREWRYAQPGLK